MWTRNYVPKPGLQVQWSTEGLSFEQRKILLELDLIEEKWVQNLPEDALQDVCEVCDLFEVEMPEVPEPPPAHDGNLAYAASKGLALFPFQEIGVGKMELLTKVRIQKNGNGRGGVLLFDEMGLGKTMEAIAFVAKMRPPPKRVLVICPNTLKIEWKKAIETWLEVTCGSCGGVGRSQVEDSLGRADVEVAAGDARGFVSGRGRDRGSVGAVEEEGREDAEEEVCKRCRGGGVRSAVFATKRGGLRRFRDLPDTPGWTTAPMRWMITNYETMRSKDYMDILQAFKPEALLFDEAHRLRNWERKTAKASRDLVGDVEILMTGTPVVNHAGDLWSLISRVAPGLAGSPNDFEQNFVNLQRGHFGARKFGVKNQALLKALLEKVAVQRKKEEVLTELPPKVYREVPLLMENSQKDLYEQMERQLFIMLDSGMSLQADSVLAQMTRLRQLCCDPRILGVGKGQWVTGAELGLPEEQWEELFKVGEIVGVKTEFLLEFLEDIGDEQVVIFSNFERYISLIEEDMGGKWSYVRLTGKEVGDQRALNIEEFQRGEAQIILGTTQAGGEGVNLQVASKVVLMDRWWSPVRNEQAIDRLHRIGQVASVQAVLPHCEETIDDALREILHRKFSIINELRIQGDTVELMKKWRGKRR